MPRERRNAPHATSERQRSRAATTDSIRRRISDEPDIELSEEELRALADEGIDPEDIRRAARERVESDEASDHDRDTARDALEGLATEAEQEY